MTHTLPLPDFTHERVEVITGRRSGLFITVALHSSVLGSALGGARLWTYPHWSDALGDALRLSAAMTLKNAAAGLDAGGGKSVIALPPGVTLDAERRRAAFLDLGDAVESLHGLYRTAEDVGSTTEDMLVVSERTEHVVGPARRRRRLGRARRPDEPRRVRVAARDARARRRHDGCRRSPHHDLGSRPGRQPPRGPPRRRGRRCSPITDVNPAKRDLALELGAAVVPAGRGAPRRAPTSSCPPASAASSPTRSSTRSTPRPSAVPRTTRSPRAAEPSGSPRRGILYAPDFVVNAGGVIYLDLEAKHLGSRSRDHGARGGDRRHRAAHLRRGGVARRHAARGRRGAGGRAPQPRHARAHWPDAWATAVSRPGLSASTWYRVARVA